MLSAQAEALRKGSWGGSGELQNCISVSPARFDEQTDRQALGAVSIHFWSVDDRYGPPQLTELSGRDDLVNGDDGASVGSSSVGGLTAANKQEQAKNRLTLCITAVTRVGMVVSLSGSNRHDPELQQHVDNLLMATCNPFALSASDALLAAAIICAERRCIAVVESLQEFGLPDWIHLSSFRGSIIVAAKINFSASLSDTPFVELFHLSCDSRTGGFVAIFPRSAPLLQLLACNSTQASERQALRAATFANSVRRKTVRDSTGRLVRDAFDSLTRSLDVLGRRVGVGGSWDNKDAMSPSLRQRAVQTGCRDVRKTLMSCCGMGCVFGYAALACTIATGMDPDVDMAGGVLHEVSNNNTDTDMLNVCPLSVLMDQHMVEEIKVIHSDEQKKISLIQQELFGITCSVTSDVLELRFFDITTRLSSPVSVPERKTCIPVVVPQQQQQQQDHNGLDEPPVIETQTLVQAVNRLATLISAAFQQQQR
mmetsp:Transcript_13407/g.20322  ORF Transcript_13407/g.20322 Transcript_13407/m.20322 type:complete len:482 (+) Transcript_13407:1-1446(+)